MDPMDRIRDLLGRVTDLSDQELTELRDLVLQQINEMAPDDGSNDGTDAPDPTDIPDDGTLAVMRELANASATLNGEIGRRNSARGTQREFAAAKAGIAELASGDTAVLDPPAATQTVETTSPDGTTVSTTTETPVAPADGATPAEGAPADNTNTGEGQEGGEGVTASGDKIEVPDAHKPKVTAPSTRLVVTASADVPGFPLGSTIEDALTLGKAMTKRIETLRHTRGGDGEQVIVASVTLDGVPETRHLSNNDSESNYRKVMEVMQPGAIVAAGGNATPVDTRYDLFGAGVTDRPVKGALPSFTADRGGIRFITPPTLGNLSGAVGIWTLQNDSDAVSVDPDLTKPVLRVAAGSEVVVHTQAVTVGLVFGNMQARAYPELVARQTDLSMVAHARVAEQQLLAQIGALSLSVKSPTQVVGAARHVLAQVDKAAAGYQNRYRTGALPIHVIFPQWFKFLLRADVAMQLPGDGLDTLSIADAMIDAWFAARNLNVTWALDGESGQDYAAQGDAVSGTPAALLEFPTTMLWYMFAEGTFLFLDGGTLDLGIVRDSTLNAKNDYQSFVETFEAVAKVGHESLRVTTTIAPTGATAAAVATAAGSV